MSSVVISGDSSGTITLQAPAVSGSTTINLPATSGTATVMPTGYTLGAGNTSSFKNRIINGAMMIDQRNAGASVTATTTGAQVYTLDRWAYVASVASKYTVQQNAGSVTPPTGFTNYLGITSLSAYTPLVASDNFNIQQNIEGFNVSDLGWGTANAKTVTLSFWVRSSLTGTFGGVLKNSAADRSYPFSYTISSSNTWTQISLTIPGDTTGTWLTTNGVGIKLIFGLGVGSTLSGTAGAWAAGNYSSVTGATSVVGTSGATFYITGVQLEVDSTATSFDYRDISTETLLCRRYYQYYPYTSSFSVQPGSSTAYISAPVVFNTTMRVAPTATFTAPSGGSTGNIEQWGGTTRAVNSYNIGINNLQYIVLGTGVQTYDAFQYHLTLNAEL